MSIQNETRAGELQAQNIELRAKLSAARDALEGCAESLEVARAKLGCLGPGDGKEHRAGELFPEGYAALTSAKAALSNPAPPCPHEARVKELEAELQFNGNRDALRIAKLTAANCELREINVMPGITLGDAQRWKRDAERRQKFIASCQQLLGTHDSLEVAIERFVCDAQKAVAALAAEKTAHAETKSERDALAAALILSKRPMFPDEDIAAQTNIVERARAMGAEILATHDAEVQRKATANACQAVVTRMCGEEIASTGNAEPTVENVCGWWKLDLERVRRETLARVMACRPNTSSSGGVLSAWKRKEILDGWQEAIKREFSSQ